MLIAHLKAHLVTGETVELLPVRHETDVKKELTGLLEGWASSGFLIWEKFVYPWHQVQIHRSGRRKSLEWRSSTKDAGLAWRRSRATARGVLERNAPHLARFPVRLHNLCPG